MYWLDYSAAKLSGATIKAAGYGGVIRYIDAPERLTTKHTNLSEYQSHLAAGLAVQLVFQTTTTASDGGYLVGQEHARRALAGAKHLGYKGRIYFTNDRTTVPNVAAWRGYLDGAASVLGIERVGAYGFANAIELAVGHATYFWQSGRRTDLRPHAHLWQDNNVQVTVGGITCDRNLVLKDITEVDMATVDEIVEAIKWRVLASNDFRFEGNRNFADLSVQAVRNGFEVSAKVDGITSAVAALVAHPDITKEELVRIVDEATPSAADVAAEIRPGLVADVLALLGPIVTEAAGEEIAAAVVRNLGEALVGKQEGNPA